MAVTQTGAMYKSLTFDNKTSREFGVYITGEAVYNAPERDVEMITIPGRNGSFALDNGRFQNIEVSYPAGIFAETESDFAQAVSDFRNFLCSKKGYCRLTDEYNPSEYRMAVYKSGLEVDPAQLRAGEFTITFECKPQRWLTSGETATAVASGGTVTNPTLFESSPLLEVVGYGDITVNSSDITIENTTYGEVLLANKAVRENMPSYDTISPLSTNNLALMNNGDTISVMSGSMIILTFTTKRSTDNDHVVSITASKTSGDLTGTVSPSMDFRTGRIAISLDGFNYAKGTSSSHTMTLSVSVTYLWNGTSQTWSDSVVLSIDYNTSTIKYFTNPAIIPDELIKAINLKSYIAEVYGYSTKNITDTIYMDLDIGEAYIFKNDIVSSVNNIVSFPADLPKLLPGSNTITYDNTFTSFDVVPRWWKV